MMSSNKKTLLFFFAIRRLARGVSVCAKPEAAPPRSSSTRETLRRRHYYALVLRANARNFQDDSDFCQVDRANIYCKRSLGPACTPPSIIDDTMIHPLRPPSYNLGRLVFYCFFGRAPIGSGFSFGSSL
uniref:Secreted protein n=1 Tax=Leptocylindrus danicus TaxID=163516 RepID=A0A6U2QQR4_9STRA